MMSEIFVLSNAHTLDRQAIKPDQDFDCFVPSLIHRCKLAYNGPNIAGI